jgi:hypothetical protein
MNVLPYLKNKNSKVNVSFLFGFITIEAEKFDRSFSPSELSVS